MTTSTIKNMSISIDHEKRRILFVQWGKLTKDNSIIASMMIHSAEGFDPTYNSLIDYTGIQSVEIGYGDFLGTIKELNKIERRNGKVALVNGPNDKGRYYLAVLFSEMANFLKSRCTYKGFSTVEEAEAWLDS